MVIMSSGLGLLGPYLVGMAIDEFIVEKETAGLLLLLVWLLIIYFLHSSAIFLQNFWMIGIAQNTVYTLRKQLFEQFHEDRKSTRLNSSHVAISYAVFCL